MQSRRPDIRIVLVEPAEPANVGAVARVMKTTGLSHLSIVCPQCDHLADAARWVAHRSEDLLESARIVATLDAAIEGRVIVAGFTARPSVYSRQWHGTVKQFAALWRRRSRQSPVPTAFVFGSERCGLSNAELDQCTHVVTIPMPVRRPALNLSHAVMVACYEFFGLSGGVRGKKKVEPATITDIARLVAATAVMVRRRDVLNEHHRGILMRALRHVLTRVPVAKQDLHVLYKVLEVVHGEEGKMLDT